MAIQLNERDQLIFKLIDEHEVLLEKHISWFIAGDDKPVLIRDRLRKLFYLDYLLCHRHGSKLPWWTTPTKPLVYVLSSMARKANGFEENQDDVMDNDFQRHHLEIANLRMLFLVAQKNGQIKNFTWTTFKKDRQKDTGLNAKVTFEANGKTVTLGLVNHWTMVEGLNEKLTKSAVSEGLDHTLVIAREEADKKGAQMAFVAQGCLSDKALFSTHQDLYREGILDSGWQTARGEAFNLASQSVVTEPAFISNYTTPPIAV